MNTYLPQDKHLRNSSIATLGEAAVPLLPVILLTQNLVHGLRGSTPYLYAYTVNDFLFIYL